MFKKVQDHEHDRGNPMALIVCKNGKVFAQVCCAISPELKESARNQKINISALLTEALKNKLAEAAA